MRSHDRDTHRLLLAARGYGGAGATRRARRGKHAGLQRHRAHRPARVRRERASRQGRSRQRRALRHARRPAALRRPVVRQPDPLRQHGRASQVFPRWHIRIVARRHLVGKTRGPVLVHADAAWRAGDHAALHGVAADPSRHAARGNPVHRAWPQPDAHRRHALWRDARCRARRTAGCAFGRRGDARAGAGETGGRGGSHTGRRARRPALSISLCGRRSRRG
jgi:hypothetical protein